MSADAVKSFVRSASLVRNKFPISTSLSAWQNPIEDHFRQQAAFLTIDLNDIWSAFCRQLVVENAIGRAVDLAGQPIIPTSRFRDPASVLSAVSNRRGYEPRWHQAREAVEAERKCRSNKSSQITAALFSANSPAPYINTIRNYFCHRRSDCQLSLQVHQYYHHSMQFCAFRIANFPRSDGRRTFEFWIDELTNIAIACSN